MKPILPPTQITPGKPTVVLPGVVLTNAGQVVRVRVLCRPLNRDLLVESRPVLLGGAGRPTGDVALCSVRTTKKGKVTVTVLRPPVRVIVTYSAPAVPGYRPYLRVES